MPHTSVRRFRKCGENPSSADQTPILDFRDLRFYWCKSGCARRFPVSPHFRNTDSASRVLATKAASATTSSCRGNVRGPLSETEQRLFFVSALRRVRGDCITENILQQHQAPGIPGDAPLFRKLIPYLETIQLAVWQIPVLLQTTHNNSWGNSYLIGKRYHGTMRLVSNSDLSI